MVNCQQCESLIPVLYFLLLGTARAEPKLGDIMRDVDKFFEGITGSPEDIHREMDVFKALMKRSYNLGGAEHPVGKRSLDVNTEFIRDEKGVYFIKNIIPVAHVPVKFPSDIQIISAENGILYVAGLESNEYLPETRLANELVLYRVEEEGNFVDEVARIDVSGGYRIAYSKHENVTYILSSEHDADNEKPFEGSAVYSLKKTGVGYHFLDRIQVLNISKPRDIKFWHYQNEMYLAVGAGDTSGFGNSHVLVYKWLTHHFDIMQKIEGSNVKSVTPFVIGSFMYLAIANHQDIYGNTVTDSEIYRYHLQTEKFVPFQKLTSHAVSDISHFKFRDSDSEKEAHFLAFANSYEMDEDGDINYRTDSYLYKYNDNHFAPFQKFQFYRLLQWHPVMGSKGEFLLLALCSYTVLGFQYDGWRFTQVQLDYGQSSFGSNIVSVRSFIYNENIYLTFADKSSDGSIGPGANLWKISFEHKNTLEEEYEKVEKWCRETMSEVEADDLDQIFDELHSHLQQSSASGSNDNKLVMEEAEIDTMEAESFDVYNADVIADLNEMNERLKEHRNRLDELKRQMENDDLFVYYDVMDVDHIPLLNLNCPENVCCTFENINIGTLNGKDFLSFINNAVVINEDIFNTRLEFEDVHLVHDLSPQEINGHPAETLLDTQQDVFLNSELVIDGTVIIQGNLVIPEEYVPLLKSEDELLMERLQNYTGDLTLDSARVENLEIYGKINGVELDKLLKNSTFQLRDTFDTLSVNNLNIKGSIVGFENFTDPDSNIPENDAKSDTLVVDELWVTSGVISGVNISDLVQTTAGKSYEIPANLIFTQSEMEINELEVSENVIGEGVTIIVEESATLDDISDPTGTLSVTNTLHKGILLNTTVIDKKLEFGNLMVDDVEVEEINAVPVSSWVLADSDEVQVIEGFKIFLGDVTVEESLVVKEVNGIDLEKLKEDTLYLEGDQTITAENISFAEIVADGITSDFVSVCGENVSIPETIKIIGSVEVDRIVAENVTVSGPIDGLSWDDIVADSVFGRDDVVTGTKTVDGSVKVRRVEVSGTINSIPVDEFLKGGMKDEEDVEDEVTEFEIPGDLELDDTLNVNSLYFEGSLDSVEKSRFGNDWLLSDGDQHIQAPMVFADVDLEKGATLKNEVINKIDLKRLFRDSLKVNESIHIKHLTANNIIAKEIIVGGTVNGAKFRDSVLLAKSDTPQIITGSWFLKNNLYVNGSFKVDGFISGVNVSHLCRVNPFETGKFNVIVGGNVKFDKEPLILSDVNGVNLENLTNEIWLKNEDVVLDGSIKFCNLEVHGNATLRGRMNDMDLDELSKNYMSKTRKQIVTGNVTVRNLLIRDSSRIRNVTVHGNVNGIDFDSWSKSVLLQDEDQIITARHFFTEFETENLVLHGTVNGVDLATDVLRRDVENAVITGAKTFHSVSVRDLIMPEGKKIQGVSVDEWVRRAVMKNGNFTLTGQLTLNNPVFMKDLNVSGTVNDIIFDADHVLLTSGNQTITGRKTFAPKNQTEEGPILKINHLIALGNVSGVDIKSLLDNQAFADEDIVFTGKKSFGEVTITGQLTVKGLFAGENITQICHDLANPPKMRNLTEQFQELYTQAKIMRENFKEGPFFLDHYESVQTLSDDVFAVLPFSNEFISVITPTQLRLMEWDHFSRRFVYKEDGVLTLLDNITFVSSGLKDSGTFLYMEISNESKIFDSGRRMHIPVSGTSCVASFELPSLDKTCYFVGREWNESTIYCNSSVAEELEVFQTMSTVGSLQVSSFRVQDDVYIAVINKERILDRVENYLVVYKYDPELQSFRESSTLPEVNPIAVSTIAFNRHLFLAIAGGHLPESVDSSIVTIFRMNKDNDMFIRYQSLLVDTPVDIRFSQLPTNELVLYVLSTNPSKPFIVFMYRGIRGFVEETSGPTLYIGSRIDAVTYSEDRHFVFLNGFGRGQILRAGFKGNKIP